MATANTYALLLRADGRSHEKTHGDGVPFFVPQLAKVKTNVICQTNNKHLLFSYEKAGGSDLTGGGGSTSPSAPHLPYRKQGDQSYYTDENLKKRRQLMEDKKVLAGIARFWDTFPNVRHGATAIDEHDYVDVFMKFYKALVAPHEFSIGEARKIVGRDWGRDVGDSDAMNKALFFRALFEVADIWTIGISTDEYVSFLNKLFNRVTMKIQDSKTSLWVTVFAELDKIRSFAEPKESIQSIASAALAAGMAAVTTNQDQESLASNASGLNSDSSPTRSDLTGVGSGSSAKSRPPLLKKKTMSSDAVLSSGDSSVASTGSSLRRLPELSTTLGDPAMGLDLPSKSTTKGEQQSYRLNDSVTSTSGANSSRGDSANLQSPNQKMALSANGGDNNSTSDGSNGTKTLTSPGPITYRQSRFNRTGSLKNDLNSPSRRSAPGESAKEVSGNNTSRPTPSDLPPQPVRLAMPSIYLSPDLTDSQATHRAARRRIRESSKLAQRLRRITF